jgi:hypothetical protein
MSNKVVRVSECKNIESAVLYLTNFIKKIFIWISCFIIRSSYAGLTQW